jgi:hypothetical protein
MEIWNGLSAGCWLYLEHGKTEEIIARNAEAAGEHGEAEETTQGVR